MLANSLSQPQFNIHPKKPLDVKSKELEAVIKGGEISSAIIDIRRNKKEAKSPEKIPKLEDLKKDPYRALQLET